MGLLSLDSGGSSSSAPVICGRPRRRRCIHLYQMRAGIVSGPCPTRRARSPARRCAPTAVWFCVELGAVGDQVGAEPAVRVAPSPDLLQASEVLVAEEPVRPAC